VKPEEAFQKQVIDLAHLHGWLVAHFRTAKVQTKQGVRYMTPVGADGKGFPDLVLVRERVIYAELKAKTGRLRPDQVVWMDKLLDAGAAWYLWRPQDLDDINQILNQRRAR